MIYFYDAKFAKNIWINIAAEKDRKETNIINTKY